MKTLLYGFILIILWFLLMASVAHSNPSSVPTDVLPYCTHPFDC